MDVAVLGVMVPIIAIVMGVGSGMLKMHYKHKEKMMNHMSCLLYTSDAADE